MRTVIVNPRVRQEKPDHVQLRVWIPVALMQRLKQAAIEDEQTLSVLVERMIRKNLNGR